MNPVYLLVWDDASSMDDILLFVNWCVRSFKSLWSAMGNWGYIGAFIIFSPLLYKLVQVLKNVWKGGL